MKKLACSVTGLVLAATAAHAQPAEVPANDQARPAEVARPTTPADPATPATPADPASETGATPAEAATPAEPASRTGSVATEVTDAEIDSFAQATVKLQAIQDDASISADQKQAAMRAAVAEAGLDPAKYNAIGQAAAADATLRIKVQTAMSKYAPQPTEG